MTTTGTKFGVCAAALVVVSLLSGCGSMTHGQTIRTSRPGRSDIRAARFPTIAPKPYFAPQADPTRSPQADPTPTLDEQGTTEAVRAPSPAKPAPNGAPETPSKPSDADSAEDRHPSRWPKKLRAKYAMVTSRLD